MYRVSLAQFEGPLDLLLFFVKRDELDIYDIPIARIADEFLAYVRVLEQLDLDRAGEFVYMAALLIEIKVRMILPRTELDEEGEPIDPRTELVDRLLEYMRFKEASARFDVLQERRAEHFTRGVGEEVAALGRPEGEEAVFEVSLFHLVSALRLLLEEAPDEPLHDVRRQNYTVQTQRAYVFARLVDGTAVSFRSLVLRKSRAFVIATFLAILEILREGKAQLIERMAESDFYLQAVSS